MTQNSFINFLGSRRSVTAKKMERGRIDKDHLRQILSSGHTCARPWSVETLAVNSNRWRKAKAD